MENKKALKVLDPRSVWLPVAIGLSLIFYMAYRDDQLSLETLHLLSDFYLPFLLVILLVAAIKDGLNAWRVRSLSHNEMGMAHAFRIILLWEFAIAVTPPIIGAAAVLVFIIYKEGQPFGKALAYTLLLAILDNLFLLTASPLAIWWSGGAVLPEVPAGTSVFEESLSHVFWLSYSSIVVYTSFMLSALLLFPKTIRKLMSGVMGIKMLSRWKAQVMKQSDELILASQVLKGQSALYWLKLLGITYMVWIFKFALVNIWVNGFVGMESGDQLLMIGRHITMWVVMLVSPSPGNAGTAEFIYPVFYRDFAGSYTFVSSMLWRFSTYYPYLLIGVFLIPRWWKK